MTAGAEWGEVTEPGLGLPADVKWDAVMALDVVEAVRPVLCAKVDSANFASYR
jgi:hypothetical protein